MILHDLLLITHYRTKGRVVHVLHLRVFQKIRLLVTAPHSAMIRYAYKRPSSTWPSPGGGFLVPSAGEAKKNIANEVTQLDSGA